MSSAPDPVDPIAYPAWLDQLIDAVHQHDGMAEAASRVDLATDALGAASDVGNFVDPGPDAEIPGFGGLNHLGLAAAMVAQYRESPAATRGGKALHALLGGLEDLAMNKTIVLPVIDAALGNPVANTISALTGRVATAVEGAFTGDRASAYRSLAEAQATKGLGGRVMGRPFSGSS